VRAGQLVGLGATLNVGLKALDAPADVVECHLAIVG
jgi:hypothetical protein